ncbi:MAG: c-type cytochrome [Geminicoccaceae bacterium]
MGRRSLYFAFPLIVAAAAGVAWTLMAREHPPGDPADNEQVAVGAALYAWNCARCHGQDLGGELGWVKNETGLSDEEVKVIAERLGDVAPAHDEGGATSRLDDAMLFRVIAEGPEKALNKPDSRMSGFDDRLVEEEIWSIIAFMKSHWDEAETAAN